VTAHKYGAKSIEIDGHKFPSLAEGRRYEELKLLQYGGAIEGLELQPIFPLSVNGVKIGTYRADFTYRDCETGEQVVEDVKGVATPVYKLKAKLVRALYGVTVQEVNA
jgi:hypothetical protein